MKLPIVLLDIILLVPFLFFSLYLAFLSFMAVFRRPKPVTEKRNTYRRFAVLVPAHNEELVIERTLNSLAKLEYPSAQFDIVVIADNCTDQTASVSEAMGVRVLRRFDGSQKGKGYALKWCFDQLMASDTYDAFVVIDADTVASSNLLKVMNAYLEDGSECIQCSDMAIPQPGAWSPEITRVAMLLYNFVRPLGGMSLGCTTGLHGNGMCLSKDLLIKYPWNSFSRTEDLEYSIELAMSNTKVQFAPEAEVRAVMPTDPHNAETQRKRWELARFVLIRKYAKPLLLVSLRGRSLIALSTLIELMLPAFANMFVFTCLLAITNVIPALHGIRWLAWPAILWSVAFLLQVFHVIAGFKAAKADLGAYTALLSFPRYALWKLRLYAKTLFNGDDLGWIRTAREKNK